jgi:hypothetical protein
MDKRTVAEKGAARAKEMAEHIERLATNIITGDTASHFTKAGKEILDAVNETVEDMGIPADAKKHILTAEKEALLAMKGFLDAAIKEIDRAEGTSKKQVEKLKKIKIK